MADSTELEHCREACQCRLERTRWLGRAQELLESSGSCLGRLSCSNDSDGSKKQPQSSSTTGGAQRSRYIVWPDHHEVEQWAVVGQTNDVDRRRLRQEQRKQVASSVAE
ncbi:hypothetical protein NL676_038931 [Syzygium grande]|nr:hypothetical protein NL676_038931 [Syzygium grande]